MARHIGDICFTCEDGSCTIAEEDVRPNRIAELPAALEYFPPRPGCASILCISDPILMLCRGKVFPIFVSCGLIIVPGTTSCDANI